MTPLDALDPYIACEDASFNISIDSISDGFRLSILGIIMPSTTNNGALEPWIDLSPRILMTDEAPGSPVPVEICVPEACPLKSSVTFGAGNFANCSDLTVDTAPVRSFFLTVPYPITTISSSSLLSSTISTVNTVRFFNSIV